MNPNQQQTQGPQPIVITDFTGAAENPHIGSGAVVGFDLFTTKTVARLSRKMNQVDGGVATHFPLYITEDNNGYLYVQADQGAIYISIDQGLSWSQILANNVGGVGTGLTVWQDYLWAFRNDDVDLYGPLSGSPVFIPGWWTAFTGANNQPLVNQVDVDHIPFPNPSLATQMNICNGNYIAQVDLLTFPFNPAGGNTVAYNANNKKFTMQPFYNATNIGFLPPQSVAISVENRLNNSSADIVIWDGIQNTTAINVVNVPGASGPVKQLGTKNGILYCVTDKEHSVYTTNGTSAQLVDRLSLRMSNRKITGEQYTTRLASTIYPQGMDFLGPELLTGGSNFPAPSTQISGTGLFPYGVWSVNIENSSINLAMTGQYTVGCRFPLSHGDINALYTSDYEIGFIKVLSGGVVLVGWRKGNSFGIDRLDDASYISNSATTWLESQLLEVGSRLDPKSFTTMQFNLVTPLNSGESLQFYYRINQSLPYVAFGPLFDSTRMQANVSDVIQTIHFRQRNIFRLLALLYQGQMIILLLN
jgi:hypothetical protein